MPRGAGGRRPTGSGHKPGPSPCPQALAERGPNKEEANRRREEKDMGYYEKRIWSGPLLEVSRYNSLRAPGKKAGRGPAEEAQAQKQELLNDINAWKKLNRLILCNFSQANRDQFITYTHRQAITQEAAMKEERNLIARLKRARKKAGLEPLKYIAVTEEQGGWHTHLIVNGGLTLDQLVDAWGSRGRVMVSPLEEQSDYKALARYVTKQDKECRSKKDEDGRPAMKTPRQKYQRRWHGSRNLLRPVEEVKPAPRPRAGEPKPPKGYRLINWAYGVDSMGYAYLEYSCMAEDGRGKKHGRKKRSVSAGAHRKRGAAAAIPVGPHGQRRKAGAENALSHPQ